MSATLDGQALFGPEHLELEYGAFVRESVERRIAGLDGVLSIDLGRRGRQIRQKGMLRAGSRKQLDAKIEGILAYMDGKEHTLLLSDGGQIGSLRMDSLRTSGQRTSGGGIVVDYEITYTQLKVW